MCLVFNSADAQNSLHYFADTIRKGNHAKALSIAREKEFIYVGGQSFDTAGYSPTPSVVKLDTAGKVLWTYTLNREIDVKASNGGPTPYANGSIIKVVTDDDAVYAQLSVYGGWGYPNYYELWKIDKQTGGIQWKRQIPEIISLSSVSASEFAISYNTDQGVVYDLLGKVDGRSVFTKVIGSPVIQAGDCTFMIDGKGGIYVSNIDTLTKYADTRLQNQVWKRKMIAEGGRIVTVNLQGDGSFFVLGVYNSTWSRPYFIGRYSQSDGSNTWTTRLWNDAVYDIGAATDFKVSKGAVFLSVVHGSYGSVYTAYRLWKLDRSNGAFKWVKNYHPNTGYLPFLGSPYAGINSFDVDERDNVYYTGYQKAHDPRRGEWGIGRVDSSGNFTYNKPLFDGPVYNSSESKGVYSFVFNNRVFHLGELQKSATDGRTDVAVVGVDTAADLKAGPVVRTHALQQGFSSVKDIQPFSTSKYAVLKQVGSSAVVELKNASDGSLVWSKTISRGHALDPFRMIITADNMIEFAASGYSWGGMQYDHRSKADYFYFIKIDSLGTVVWEKNYNIASTVNFTPIQLYASGDTNIVFVYSKFYRDGLYTINFFNPHKAASALASYSDEAISTPIHLPVRQSLILPIAKDSILHFRSYPGYDNAHQLILSFQKNNYGSGMAPGRLVLVNLNIIVSNLLFLDSSDILLAGRTLSGTQKLMRNNYKTNVTSWTVTQPASSTIYAASAFGNSIYLTGGEGAGFTLSKRNALNGSLIWEKKYVPANNKQYYVLQDQRYNPVKHQYTVCGYLGDSTNTIPTQEAFYLTIDTLGNVITEWRQKGDFLQKNQLNVIGITPYGQTVIGGALYKQPHGRSGLLIEANTPLKAPAALTVTATPDANGITGDTIVLKAASHACEACTFIWNDLAATKDAILKVTASGTYTVTVSNVAGSIRDSITVNFVRPPIRLAINAEPGIVAVAGDTIVLRVDTSTCDQCTYTWSDGARGTGPELKVTTSGTYTVLATNAAGNISASQKVTFVTAPSPILITVTPSASVCTGDTVLLKAHSAGCINCTYEWNDHANTKDSVLKVTQTGTYSVKVSNIAGNTTLSQAVQVRAVPMKPIITQTHDTLFSSASAGNQWYLDSQPIAGATAVRYKPFSQGTYTLMVTVDGCKSLMSDPFNFTVTAIIDPGAFENKIKIFPNPVVNRLTILNKTGFPVTATLYSITGGNAIAAVPNIRDSKDFYLGHLPQGIYVLLITDIKTNKSMRQVIWKN